MNRYTVVALSVVALAMAFAVQPSYAGDAFKLTVGEKEIPSELHESVTKELDPKSYTLSKGDTPVYDFWFVKSLKAEKGENQAALESIFPVTLVGAVTAHGEENFDFRDDPVDPGVYTLRFALQPQDGNHMGTAPNDTFVILVPAAYDKEVEGAEYQDILEEVASEDTVAGHPPILNLQGLEEKKGDLPHLAANEEEEWKYLVFNLTGEDDGETFPIAVQLVYRGMGEL